MDAITPTGAAPQPAGVHEPRPEKPEATNPAPDSTAKVEPAQAPQTSPADKGAGTPPKLIPSPGFSGQGLQLRIEVDEATGSFIYLAVDTETGEIVRQYPPEDLIRHLEDYQNLVGLTIDRRL